MLLTTWRNNGNAGAFMFCYRKSESVLRFSYVSEAWKFAEDGSYQKETTDARRFTYLLGEGHRSRTAIQQFERLRDSGLSLKDLTKAFSVDAVSDMFFDGYKKQYEDIIFYITSKRMVKVANKWEERLEGKPCQHIMQQFSRFPNPEKAIRDYVKKLMGRLVFLQFLQKKGWLGVGIHDEWGSGDLEFIQNLFARCDDKDHFIDKVLEPLFNDLNSENEKKLPQYRTPYLNGGLFEQEAADEMEFPLPAKYMQSLLDFFASYNFTIDENDPDDAEVGVDPEMLGRIFENLLEDNKDKGAFYTPKEIVSYMCRESLIAYLQTGIEDETTKEAIRQFVTTHQVQEHLPENTDQLLKDVKICDPAIGSGAFPMGLLKELFLCRTALEGISQHQAAEIKKHIIQQNVYGVDIERGAVDIARLRFWLSLIVDEETPQALPNLDFKIMQGNSLIESYGGFDLSRIGGKTVGRPSTSTQYVIGLDSDLSQKNLQRLLREYFSVTDHQKKATMRHAINAEVKTLIRESVGGTPTFLAKLEQLDPSANQDFFLWHTWFKDIFDKGGFNIVIGNPPYIRRTELPETAKVEYERTYKSATLQYDIYLLFIEFGLSICSAKAQLCFINPIRFFSSDYGKGCRPIIIKNHYLWRVVDVSQIEVFKNAMTYPCVLHIQKTECKDYEIEFYSPENLQLVCNVATSKCKFLHKQNIISDSSCRIIVSEGYDLIQKIDNNSKPIETWYNVARGLPNNKVDFEGKKYKSLKSTMVKRYRITDDYKYINTEFSARFSKEMIILPRTVLFLQATLKEKDIVLLDRIYYLTEKTVVNSKFVLGVINARITTYWFEYYYGTTKVSGGYFDLNGTQIINIPIPKATIEQQKQVAEIVDVILNEKKDNGNADTSDMEREIDRLVYKLYNLTDEEIEIVEGR